MNGTQRQAAPRAAAESSVAPKPTLWEEVIDIARTVGIAVGITLFVRFFLIQPFNIPSGSMKPTLQVGDFILVDKIDYGYSKASLIYPFTRLPLEGRLFGDTPVRGEIVVFKNAADRNRDYIKRVVGVPGDKIQVISGVLHINDQRVQRELIRGQEPDCARVDPAARLYRETLPEGGPTYIVQECHGDFTARDNFGPVIVPEGRYFMMGDNRDNSQDSRTFDVGGINPDTGLLEPHFVPLDQVVGKATRVVMSIDGEEAALWQPWRWPLAIRYGRIFSSVN